MARRDPRRAVAVAILLLAGADVSAAPPSARALFRDGVQALRIGDYEAAVLAFRASYRRAPAAETVCNLALSYDRWSGHDQEAIDAYQTCATDDTKGTFRRHALERAKLIGARLEAAAASPRPAVAPSVTPEPAPTSAPPPPPVAPPSYVAPPATPVVVRAPAPRRSHALGWAGLGVGIVGLGLVGGAISAGEQARALDASLEARYGVEIPVGSQGVQDLEDARRARGAAVGLYATGAVCLGVSLSLVIADAARSPRAAR